MTIRVLSVGVIALFGYGCASPPPPLPSAEELKTQSVRQLKEGYPHTFNRPWKPAWKMPPAGALVRQWGRPGASQGNAWFWRFHAEDSRNEVKAFLVRSWLTGFKWRVQTIFLTDIVQRERLANLIEMHQQSLITDEEFNEKFNSISP